MPALQDARALHGGRSGYNHLLWLAQSNRIASSRVREVLELVGLESVATKRTKDFSLGMAQRLGIAAALLGDPPVLLFDEPVNGLDTEGIRWIRNLMRDLAAEGRTVLVSSHLMSEIALTAPRRSLQPRPAAPAPRPRRPGRWPPRRCPRPHSAPCFERDLPS